MKQFKKDGVEYTLKTGFVVFECEVFPFIEVTTVSVACQSCRNKAKTKITKFHYKKEELVKEHPTLKNYGIILSFFGVGKISDGCYVVKEGDTIQSPNLADFQFHKIVNPQRWR